MSEPSYKTSTLSLLTVVVTGFYAAFAVLIAVSTIFFKLPLDTAKEVMAWPTLLWTNVTTAYFTARKTGNSQEPPKP